VTLPQARKRPRRSLKPIVLFCTCAVLLTSIPGAGAAPPPSPDPAATAALAASYNRWVAGLRTVRAGGRAHVGADGEATRAFDFSMVLARPEAVRLQGRWGSLATLFDLSGDGRSWTLYLPRERTVVRETEGSEAGAGLLIPPAELLAVLLPVGIPPRDLERRGAASTDGDLVRLVVPPGRGGAGSAFHRVLWLHPDDGTPARLEVRRRTQLEPPLLTAIYHAYEGKGEKAFPVDVEVRLEAGGQWARFVFETARINTEVKPEVFTLRVPEGTTELDPEDLTPDFLPEADDATEPERP